MWQLMMALMVVAKSSSVVNFRSAAILKKLSALIGSLGVPYTLFV